MTRVDITPPQGLELTGYPHYPRHNTGAHDPLYAACMYLEQDGMEVAMVTLDLPYKAGFGYFFQKFMLENIQGLGFREENFIYHSAEKTPKFSKMLEDDGEADGVYSGPGWPGHLAFIDPVEDWYTDTLEEYMEQGAKVAALHPLTIAQNSLHGAFGYSGDISRVPPKGAMMGPRDAMKAKHVLDIHSITTAGSQVSWQRLTSRLCIFGEPSQEVPASILQLREGPTDIIISENAASTILPDPIFQY